MVSSMEVGLRLAAAPCFVCMAFVTNHGTTAGFCSTSHGWPVDGMAAMYLLMGLFHLSPWLALVSGRMGTKC
jgi:hypothetical protein